MLEKNEKNQKHNVVYINIELALGTKRWWRMI